MGIGMFLISIELFIMLVILLFIPSGFGRVPVLQDLQPKSRLALWFLE
jgi:hypothetical protein